MDIKIQPPPPHPSPSLMPTPYICCKVKYKRINCKIIYRYTQIWWLSVSPQTSTLITSILKTILKNFSIVKKLNEIYV